MSGEKTQTRRLVKPGEWLATFSFEDTTEGVIYRDVPQAVMTAKNRPKWHIERTYAVQPGRAQKGIARIRITGIRAEDVRNISDEDIDAEGFLNREWFMSTWCKMHDREVNRPREEDNLVQGIELSAFYEELQQRPADRYQAWVITFQLCAQR